MLCVMGFELEGCVGLFAGEFVDVERIGAVVSVSVNAWVRGGIELLVLLWELIFNRLRLHAYMDMRSCLPCW